MAASSAQQRTTTTIIKMDDHHDENNNDIAAATADDDRRGFRRRRNHSSCRRRRASRTAFLLVAAALVGAAAVAVILIIASSSGGSRLLVPFFGGGDDGRKRRWRRRRRFASPFDGSAAADTSTPVVGDEEGAIRKFAASDRPRVLNVHVVPHTHDDVGWRKTVEQYYYGRNETIDKRGNVRRIISSVVESLASNPARTFVIVEMKFFSMWWSEQPDGVKDTVRNLVSTRQLGFVNGGWSMHDEACTHYVGMIDQTALGHDFLKRELGYAPTVGWQLDPFGHSSTQASLMTAKMGMDALYFGRIDYQDLQLRQLTKQCEGLWQPPSTADGGVFWGLTGSYQGNYGPPEGFWFDALSSDEPLVGANETRFDQRLRLFLEDLRVQADQTQGNHIMLTMGSDFHVRIYSIRVVEAE